MSRGKQGLKFFALTVMLVFGLTGPVSAADDATPYKVSGSWFKRADKDRNKLVSKDEAGRLASRDFLRLDRNSDGTATVEEIDQRLMERVVRSRERLLRRLDANRDRAISKSEIDARTRGMFAHIDADGNGGITLDELKSYRQAIRKARQAERRAKRAERAKAAGQE